MSNVPGFAVGDGQFRLAFTVHASSTIQIGDGGSGDGAIGNGGASLASNNTSVAFSVIPEPGTALLMGLGLAGLGLAGRRE
ncbi:MAG: PEP-CTERM sorting domain-containing protein [bacterium]|nr:PEP-CTERM sorting domain-containing protein [bacterium]